MIKNSKITKFFDQIGAVGHACIQGEQNENLWFKNLDQIEWIMLEDKELGHIPWVWGSFFVSKACFRWMKIEKNDNLKVDEFRTALIKFWTKIKS